MAMNFRKITALLCALAAISSCVKEINPPKESDLQGDPVVDDSCVIGASNEIIVQFSEEMTALIEEDLMQGSLQTKSGELNSVLEMFGAKSAKRVFSDGGRFEPRHRAAGLHRFYRLEFDTIMTRAAMRAFEDIPGVVSTEPNLRIQPTGFNDPYYSLQWHYYNNGSITSRHKSGADINVVPVWENYTRGSSDVIVAVVDGGIEYSHPDLAWNYVGGKNFCAAQSGSTGVTAHDHGTHVAGTIGAVNNNGIGVCGIAGGDYANGERGVGLLSCQIFEKLPSGESYSVDGSDAIVWGCDNGAVISQNSWGYVVDTDGDGKISDSELTRIKNICENISRYSITTAIDYFTTYAGYDENGNQTGPMAGGVVIFSAGNDNIAYGAPAYYDKVISVGAMAPDFAKSYYSNYGEWVDIAAPGGDYYYNKGMVYSTIPGGSYDYKQGTSMACPHVSGVAALIVSYFGGPGFTNEMLWQKLTGGANATATTGLKIGPLVNTLGAIEYGLSVPPLPVQSISLSTSRNIVSGSFKVTRDPDDFKAAGYLVMISKDASKLVNGMDYSNLPAGIQSKDLAVESKEVGDDLPFSFTSLDYGTTYHVAVAGYDKSGNWSSLSPVSSITTTSNRPPVITTDFDGKPFSLHYSQSKQIQFTIMDPEDQTLTVSMEPAQEPVTLENKGNGIYQVSVSWKDIAPGRYSTVLKAVDTYGDMASFGIEYSIENDPPVISTYFDGQVFSLRSFQSRQIPFLIKDPEGRAFNVFFDPDLASVTLSNQGGGTYRVSVSGNGAAPGRYSTVLKAVDTYGAMASFGIEYIILENHAPEVSNGMQNIQLSGIGALSSTNMKTVFSDPDGDEMTFTANSSDSSIIDAYMEGNILKCRACAYGLAEITVTAADMEGMTATESFKILVYDPASPEINAYPNPVTDYLKVSIRKKTDMRIVLKSQTGKLICDRTEKMDAFSPATIDMRSCMPGRYVLTLTCEGRQTVVNVMKL